MQTIRLAMILGGLMFAAASRAQELPLRYSFGTKEIEGQVRVKPEDRYTTQTGYGFDLGSKVELVEQGADGLKGGFVTGGAGRPFFFSAKLAPGRYRVKVTLGGAERESRTTVKSETRRLMVENAISPGGGTTDCTFLVHIRVAQLADGRIVRMKAREKDLNVLFIKWEKEMEVTYYELDWDEKLTLAFSGEQPALRGVEIEKADDATAVYLVGDSTMTDQMMEPWGAWGQQLPRWFAPPAVIANYAQSGETTASFMGELRWAKLLEEIKPGDYVLIQFGINDRRMQIADFKNYFLRYVDEARAKGAIPVLVTSQNLRRLDEAGKGMNTLGEFPEAIREAAREKNAPLIDLNAMSAKLYEAIGSEDLPKAFVDGTHQNMYGAYELAKCVVMGMKENRLPIAEHLVADWKDFDPAHPDPLAEFKLPADPQLDPSRPGGPGAPSGRGGMGGDPPRGAGARRGNAPATRTATQ